MPHDVPSSNPEEYGSAAALAVSLNDLRRITEVGFTKMEGQLELLNEKIRQRETEYESLKEIVAANGKKITEIEADYVGRKSLYTFLGLIAGLISAAAVALGLFLQLTSGG